MAAGDLAEVDSGGSGVSETIVDLEGEAGACRDGDGLRGGTGVETTGHLAGGDALDGGVAAGLTDGS